VGSPAAAHDVASGAVYGPVEQIEPGSVPIVWHVKVNVDVLKTEQSALVVHPGKQMNWLLPFLTQ
jgi:hypothetical protein